MRVIAEKGRLEVITGSMFSGKTEELIRRLGRAEIAEQSIAAFKPDTDDRYEQEFIGSHDGREWKATVIDTEGGDARNIRGHLNGEDVVAIDEANFFSDVLVDVCKELSEEGHRVIVTGTDQTFRGDPFEPVPQLMAVADRVKKQRAICSLCGEPATHNQRLIEGEPAHMDDPTIMVGAEESYEPRCRHCHIVRR